MEVLGIITARGGSKSIPRKNIAMCAGNPLMYYIIQAAKNAKSITRLIISTDDEEMAEYARSLGVEVPFMRPKEFAKDDSPDIETFQHALRALKEKESYVPEFLVHLRPTAPLTRASDIDKGVDLLRAHAEVDSVRSVCESPLSPFKIYRLDSEGCLQPLLKQEFPEVYKQFPEPFNAERQLLPVTWRQSGTADVVRARVVSDGKMNGEKILPVFTDQSRDIDIDTFEDLAAAERIIERLWRDKKEVWE